MTHILVDAGPLFAFFSQDDEWHEWSREQLGQLSRPPVTCESVLSEATFLIQRQAGNPEVLLKAVRDGHLRVAFDLSEHAREIVVLMNRYRHLPTSLADACLVRMSELYPDSRLITMDKDFRVYRRFSRQIIPLIAPWESAK
jgi:predicted nucleic acid-binding protein